LVVREERVRVEARVRVPVKLAEEEIVWELMVEEVEIVVIPDRAPAVETSKAEELSENVPVPLPKLIFPVPVVLRLASLLPTKFKVVVPVRVVVGAVMAAVPEERVWVNPVRPVLLIDPEVLVRDSTPVVWVKPLEAVRVLAEVIVPVLVVKILPVVVMESPEVAGERVVPERVQ
jgi:hypothetical protein